MFGLFKNKADEARIENKPWLKRKAWMGPTIESKGKATLWVAWIFAIFWNAIAIPLTIPAWREFRQGETEALFGFVFLIVGLGLLAWAITATLRWRRFGKTPLTMDPYPGAIGGQVGGTIDVNLPYDPQVAFKTTLNCLYSYMSGSGKNRSRRERVVWDSEGFAHTQPSAKGTRLEILFNVDDNLPASDFKNRSSYHLWRLHVEADLPGSDFNRSFEIPVFPTGEQASLLRQLSTEHQAAEEHRTRAIEQVLNIRQVPGGVELYYPAFRHAAGKITGIIFGVVFAAGGFFAGQHGAPIIFPIIFGGVGGLVALISIYTLLVSLRVRIDHSALRTQRRLLGIAFMNKRVPREQVERLTLKRSYSSSSGSKHKVYYKLQAQTRDGNVITIGFNMVGRETALHALESLSMLTGIEAER